MKVLALLFTLCASTCFAQTRPIAPAKLAQCQSEVKAVRSSEAEWSTRYYAALSEKDGLVAQNKELASQNAELTKKYEELRVAAKQVYDFAVTATDEYKKAAQDNANLTQKFNRLLEDAKGQMAMANERLARQQRINNTLALYSAMPKYAPVQIAPPPVFTNNSLNCTSSAVGTFTYTNCQ